MTTLDIQKGPISKSWAFWLLISSVAINVTLVLIASDVISMPTMFIIREMPTGHYVKQPQIRNKDMLSDVIFVIQDTENDLERLEASLEYWHDHPPCLIDSYPTAASKSQIVLTFYFGSIPSDTNIQRIITAYNNLPSRAASCFAELQISHAGLPNISGPITPSSEQEMWRRVFSALLSDKAGLPRTSYVLILTADCKPIQKNWLNLVDIQTRPLNEPFWIKGSIFRGTTPNPPKEVAQLIRISSAGLYNFGSSHFVDFYTSLVLPWTNRHNQTIISEFGNRWSMDIFHFLVAGKDNGLYLKMAHQFRHSDFIGDFYGRNVSLAQITRDQPGTLLICGNLVP